MRIMGLDAGSRNFGWSLIKVERTKFRIIKCGILTQTLTQLKEDSWFDELHLYAIQIEKLLRLSKPDAIIAERYFARHRGLEGEMINLMLGTTMRILFEQHPKVRTQLVMAMTWKSALKRSGFDLDMLYKECKPIPHHPIDATMQAAYLVRDKTKPKITKVLINNVKDTYMEFK